MAFLTTTLSGACAMNDTGILCTSITSFAANMLAKVDGEIMRIVSVPTAATLPVPVIRGIQGTAQVAHPSGAGVIVGATPTATGTDWAESPQWSWTPFAGPRMRTVVSYSAAGAIGLPTTGSDVVAMINGTSALAMTLAVPTTDLDGSILVIIGNGKAAHTLTVAGGMGAGGTGVDVGTFAAGAQQAVVLMAANAVWVPLPSFFGGSSLANVTVTWA